MCGDTTPSDHRGTPNGQPCNSHADAATRTAHDRHGGNDPDRIETSEMRCSRPSSSEQNTAAAAFPSLFVLRLSQWVEYDEEGNCDGSHWENMGFLSINLKTTDRVSEYRNALDMLTLHFKTSRTNRPFFIWPGEERDAPLQSPETFLSRLIFLNTCHGYKWAHISITPGLDYHIEDRRFPACFDGNVKLPAASTGFTNHNQSIGSEDDAPLNQSRPKGHGDKNKPNDSAHELRNTFPASDLASILNHALQTKQARSSTSIGTSSSFEEDAFLASRHLFQSKKARPSSISAAEDEMRAKRRKGSNSTTSFVGYDTSPSKTSRLGQPSLSLVEQELCDSTTTSTVNHETNSNADNAYGRFRHGRRPVSGARTFFDPLNPSALESRFSGGLYPSARTGILHASEHTQPLEGVHSTSALSLSHEASPPHEFPPAQLPKHVVNAPEKTVVAPDPASISATAQLNIAEAQRRVSKNFGTKVHKSEFRAFTHFPRLKLALEDVARLNYGKRANDSLLDAMINLLQPAFPQHVHVLATTGLEGHMPGGAFQYASKPSTWKISSLTTTVFFVRNLPNNNHWVLCMLSVRDGVLDAGTYSLWPHNNKKFRYIIDEGITAVAGFLKRQDGSLFHQANWDRSLTVMERTSAMEKFADVDSGFWAVSNLAHLALNQCLFCGDDDPSLRLTADSRLRGVMAYGLAICAGSDGELKPADVAGTVTRALFDRCVPQCSKTIT
jgi:hypothetical protein